MKKYILLETIVILLVIMFVYTAVSKLLIYSHFKITIGETPELRPFAFLLAPGLPSAEIIAAIFLLLPRFRKWGLYLAAILMFAFTIYVTYISFLVTHKPCICGGIISGITWKQHIILNSSFTAISLLGIWLNKKIQGTKINNYAIQFS